VRILLTHELNGYPLIKKIFLREGIINKLQKE